MVRLFLALRLLFADNMLWREMLVLFILRFTYSVIRCVSIAIYIIESLDPYAYSTLSREVLRLRDLGGCRRWEKKDYNISICRSSPCPRHDPAPPHSSPPPSTGPIPDPDEIFYLLGTQRTLTLFLFIRGIKPLPAKLLSTACLPRDDCDDDNDDDGNNALPSPLRHTHARANANLFEIVPRPWW